MSWGPATVLPTDPAPNVAQLRFEEREQRLIEERRKRRAAIAAKHRGEKGSADEPSTKVAREA